MEPQINRQSEGMPLPMPSPDVLPLPQAGPATSPETAPSGQERMPVQNQPAVQQPPFPVPVAPPQPPQPGGPIAASQATPAIADDVDLIEKEWVIKAKQIVDKTRDDPYNQSRELNKIKADYIKKRYNKQIKLAEG